MPPCRFDPSLRRICPVQGIVPLELTWVLIPFPQNSFPWEYKLKSSLCTHAVHGTDLKNPDIHVLDRRIPATKTHPACTINEDRMLTTSMAGLKNPKWWTPDILVETQKKRKYSPPGPWSLLTPSHLHRAFTTATTTDTTQVISAIQSGRLRINEIWLYDENHARTNIGKSTENKKRDFTPISHVFSRICRPWFSFLQCIKCLLQRLDKCVVVCLTSQQHACVSHGWICSDNLTCCHTETEAADQTVRVY